VYQGSGAVHAILDVTGYFAPGGDGLTWVPLAPSRVLDSRFDVGYPGPFREGVPGSIEVRGAGGVDDDAAAISANVTVVGQTRTGFVSLTPQPVSSPTTSTINFPSGDVRANGVVSMVDTSSGEVSLTFTSASGETVELLLDVSGYFH
jgi:hypothetical protein